MIKTYSENIRLIDWIQRLQARGKKAFSLRMLLNELPELSETAIKSSLSRLVQQKKVISIHKGYYLIIPPQYSTKGVLPPSLFIDGLMSYLGRPYYVGLVSAAAYHGAAHQQPQEFFVFTTFPPLRATLKKGIKINYISKKEIPTPLVQNVKTESGYLKISSPLLTAIDLLQFERRIGGLNRAVVILNELADALSLHDRTSLLKEFAPTSVIQRLGYLLEEQLERQSLADVLYAESRRLNLPFFRIPLKASAPIKGFSSDNRWQVIINCQIESDV